MSLPCPTADDPLTDFEARTITVYGSPRRVYVSRPVAAADEVSVAGAAVQSPIGLAGPAVIVMAEMPGISPHVARFARWVRDAGFCVWMPSLFGVDGAWPHTETGLAVLRRACISAEFRALGGGASSPISQWLRGLAVQAHQACGGPGVGAVGMCFTGNFALTLMLESAVLAPVMAQPSLPLDAADGLEISPSELEEVAARLQREDLSVLAYRFEGDRHCRAERFAAYARALGERFVARVLPDHAAHPSPPAFFRDVVGTPHSVFTAHFVDASGSPTRQARDEVLAFLKQRLRPGQG